MSKRTAIQKYPSWLKQPLPDQNKIQELRCLLQKAQLPTVCTSARCPNLGACWEKKVATVMILGETCTRACRFCAVASGHPAEVDSTEPDRVAGAVRDMGLKYVVITSVTRDDLSDGGAGHFARTVAAVRREVAGVRIEVLVPDFQGQRENLATIVAARPDVVAHNLETVQRLSPLVRPAADYQRSLHVLRQLRELMAVAAANDGCSPMLVKSGLMVGLGETSSEVEAAMADLAATGCDILTIGQYLAPTQTSRHVRVDRYVAPEEFAQYRYRGQELGFRFVKSGPLVRSSFLAEEGYQECTAELAVV